MNVEQLLKTHGKPEREVYFDSENSGWISQEVVNAMLPYFNKKGYGHPSITHRIGWEAYETLYNASEKIASTINSDIKDITYTHSGTEANNLAIIGGVRANKNLGKKIIVSSIEHLSVIFPAEKLSEYGFNVIKIPVNSEGIVDPHEIGKVIDKNTVLVSIMYVNHEIGSIQPLKEIIDIIRDKNDKVIIHTDAADAYGRIPIDVKKLDIDLMTLSGHKIGGPRGVGCLYIRDGVKVDKIIYGQLSTQELWPGVENVPLIVGFSKAAEMMFKNFEKNIRHMKYLRDTLIDGILTSVDETILNGPRGDKRAPDNVNISFLHCEGEAITVELSLHGIYVSSGSACTSRILQPSHVLLAIGRRYEEAHGSILFKIIPSHTIDDIKYALKIIPKSINRIRKISLGE